MRALELDFVSRSALARPMGILLLLAGIATLGIAAQDAVDTTDLESSLQARKTAEWQRAHGRGGDAAKAVSPARPQDLRALREAAAVAARLKLPWQRLFDDTAQAAGADVALTGLQPDAASRTLRITGLARDLGAVNGFVMRLQDKPGFAGAYLAQHDFQQKDADAAFGFVVLVNWREELQ